MTNVYALSDYIVTISNIPTSIISSTTHSIGGPGQNGYEGSFLDEITIQRSNTTFNTTGDSTGSWVHDKSLNRVGTVTISINQISSDVITLATIFSAFENNHTSVYRKGLTIKVTPAYDTTLIVAQCYDCFITQVPNQVLGSQAQNQSWELTCGRVEFYPNGMSAND